MKTFKTQCAQGDVMFTRVSSKPADMNKQLELEDGKLIITHSETGHHHIMNPAHVKAFQNGANPLVLFIVVSEQTELTHLRDHHTHEAIQFEPGMYQVNRQREFDSTVEARNVEEQWRRAID